MFWQSTGEHHKKTIRTMLVSALFCTIWQFLGLFDKYNMYILGKYKID
jgi:accessory gene regulator protein AgrB